jgi:hypothetical protein
MGNRDIIIATPRNEPMTGPFILPPFLFRPPDIECLPVFEPTLTIKDRACLKLAVS